MHPARLEPGVSGKLITYWLTVPTTSSIQSVAGKKNGLSTYITDVFKRALEIYSAIQLNTPRSTEGVH